MKESHLLHHQAANQYRFLIADLVYTAIQKVRAEAGRFEAKKIRKRWNDALAELRIQMVATATHVRVHIDSLTTHYKLQEIAESMQARRIAVYAALYQCLSICAAHENAEEVGIVQEDVHAVSTEILKDVESLIKDSRALQQEHGEALSPDATAILTLRMIMSCSERAEALKSKFTDSSYETQKRSFATWLTSQLGELCALERVYFEAGEYARARVENKNVDRLLKAAGWFLKFLPSQIGMRLFCSVLVCLFLLPAIWTLQHEPLPFLACVIR
jgi:predicted DNA-binding protein YlxM (UPF0122 family)